jgi:inner membrane protein
MDPLSQAVLGAAAAQALSKKTPLKTALWVGALGGVLPDVDVLIRSSEDPLLFLDYHRHFTHSLAFIPFGGGIAAWIASRLSRGVHSFRSLWLPATLGLGTHGLLDACTSYGTFLLWPFSGARIAWHNVAIIDPLFTLPLLVGVVVAMRRKNRAVAKAVLLGSILYLLGGVFQHHRAQTAYRAIHSQRGHTPENPQVKPSIANNILFRGFYRQGDVYYTDAIRVPWWGPVKTYPGTTVEALDVSAMTATLEAIHAKDLLRFSDFSGGFLIRHPGEPGTVSDFRYAAVPNAVAPLWGVVVDDAVPGKHLDFKRFNQVDATARALFVSQLLGR